MLRIGTYLLLFQFVLAVGMKVYCVIDWKINQDFITEKYCENKDKPMMNCNGQCYLSKKLEKLEQQEKEERGDYPNPQSKVEKTDFVWFVKDGSCLISIRENREDETNGFMLKTLLSQEHLTEIETPPKV